MGDDHFPRERVADLPRRRPLASVDLVIFSVRESTLHVLLVRRPADATEPFPSFWALPGGFVDIDTDADLQGCAARKLKEKTGVASPYLEQLGSWGSATRDPRGWSATHAYMALVPGTAHAERGANSADVAWVPVIGDGVRHPLAFDHDVILAAGVQRLRSKVEYTSLPTFLLPKEFTLSELQSVYETILGRKLEKSAFRTRILAVDMVEALPRVRRGPNRPARLYRLKRRKLPVFFVRTFNPPR